jgi:hypothetical protein
MTADKERLYRTILQLDYPRHPYFSPEGLKRAAGFIGEAMEMAGLAVRRHCFSITGNGKIVNSETINKEMVNEETVNEKAGAGGISSASGKNREYGPYCNIEGSCGPVETEPAWVVIAHYDTVMNSPGANDNGSGIAVMLETARILASMDNPPPVYFVAAVLEESSSPLYAGLEEESARRLGITDEQGRVTRWEYASLLKSVKGKAFAHFLGGGDQGEGFRIALQEYDEPGNRKESMPETLKRHIKELSEIYSGINPDTSVGRRSRIGSTRWVEDACRMGRALAGCIALDEIGIYSDEPGSQRENAQIDFHAYTGGYKLNSADRLANFVLILSNRESKKIGDRFEAACREPENGMPYARAHLPMGYEEISALLPKALSSDHAPFWKYGIPAIFLFDTSTPRDFWNHTAADSIDKLDFDRMGMVTGSLISFFLQEQDGDGEQDEDVR